jgi:hypothetical protein
MRRKQCDQGRSFFASSLLHPHRQSPHHPVRSLAHRFTAPCRRRSKHIPSSEPQESRHTSPSHRMSWWIMKFYLLAWLQMPPVMSVELGADKAHQSLHSIARMDHLLGERVKRDPMSPIVVERRGVAQPPRPRPFILFGVEERHPRPSASALLGTKERHLNLQVRLETFEKAVFRFFGHRNLTAGCRCWLKPAGHRVLLSTAYRAAGP